MTRATSLRLVVPLTLLVACSERPTGLPNADLAAANGAAAYDRTDERPELASTVWERTASDLVKFQPVPAVAGRPLTPIVAARAYALVGLAQYAAVDAVDARGNGSAKTDPGTFHENARRGAVAGASAQVLKYLFKLPADVAAIDAQLASEGAAGSADERAAFARGVAVGRATGDLIVERAKLDGFANANGTPKVWNPATLPAGNDIWYIDADVTPQVPAGFQFPSITPYFLTSANQFRPDPPFKTRAELTAPGGPAAEVVDIVNHRTPEQTAMAVALNLSNGTITPVGDWDQIAAGFIRERNMDERAGAHVYALVNAAVMDAVIACWDAKFTHLVLRPWQVAPLDLPNAKLVIGRPNHPSFPSGHSCVSGAAATVLERFFPNHTTSLEQHVTDNGNSRIYAGIHYRMDVVAGQQLGRDVANWAIKYDERNGLLAALLPDYRGNDNR